MRFIAHLDMDAFYASVELLRYPELRGQPVVIGGRRRAADVQAEKTFRTLRDYSGRGVVTTSTYEARALGVFSGMGLMKSAKLAPDAILLPADFDEYRHYSRLFKEAVRAVAPEIEDRGIDEIYIDLTALVMAEVPGAALDPWSRAREVAARIQQAVFEATGLSCSIGVTPNKLLSKIASDLDKPAGLTILREADVPTRIWPLAVRKINGIGPKAGAKLEALGIRTIGELARAEPALLIAHFGQQLRRVDARGGARPRRAQRGDVQRTEVDQPRDHFRNRSASGARPRAAVAHFHRVVRARGGRSRAQGLRRPHHRPQAALRQFHHRDARLHAGGGDARCEGDPARRRQLSQARAARPPHPLLGVRVGALARPGMPAAQPATPRTKNLFG